MDKLKQYLSIHKLDNLHPSEIVNLLKELSENEFKEVITTVPKDIIGDVALELPDRYFDDIVEVFNPKDLSIAVSRLESDDQTDFMKKLENIDQNIYKEVFNNLNIQDQSDILKLQQYEEDKAGAYMQTEVYSATITDNVHDVIRGFAKLRIKNELENINYLFVIDKNQKLKYSISLDYLLIFNFTNTLQENIDDEYEKFDAIYAYDNDNINDVVKKFKEYDLSVLPIVDKNNHILGRITSDDIYDIINEQATDQMYHLAGVDDNAEEDESILKAGKSRAVWLSLNLFTAILASLVIGMFQETLQSVVALAILMPIVASMGGNAGTQSLTVVVRQLALGDISKHDAYRTIRKEVVISLVNGFIFAIIMGIIATYWFDTYLLGVVIAISMIINLISAGLFGSMIPLLLKQVGVDPAIGSTVVLTTITDVVGFFSFLALATIIL